MTIDAIFKKFIPAKLQQEELSFSYAKNLVGAGIISFFTAPIYAVFYYFLHDLKAAIMVLIAELFMILSVLSLRIFDSLTFSNNLFIITFTGLMAWLTYHLGGIYSATAYWLTLPPLIAIFIGGLRFGIIWCAILIMVTTYFYIIHIYHFIFPPLSVSDPLLLQYIAICGLNLVILYLAYFYETAKQASFKNLHYLAYHDPLTNLANQLAYREILTEALAKAKKDHSSLAIIFLDIDNFRKINNVFGRAVGDLLLQDIVQRINHYIRHTDRMARVAGDEFKILLENFKDIFVVKEIVNIIFMAVKIPYHIQKHEIRITASVGVAIYPMNDIDINLIDQYADIALFKAKNMGGNLVQYFADTLAKEEAFRLEIENNLPHAIRNNEFYLNFQLQFDAQNPTKVTGLEALMRWNSKKYGDVPSSLFIPVAERIGLIAQLGEWVFREACLQFSKWSKTNKVNDAILAINISVHQLYDENFIPAVQKILQDTRINPAYLEVELTETAIITDLPYAITILQKLAEMGIKTVIDDFGSGYTSLGYLTRLPLSGLKIDKSLLDNAFNEKSNSIILESIIELAHKIHLKVVVEGVETLEQLNYLTAIGCDEVQGFYLSKPLDVESTEKRLSNTSNSI